MTWPWEDVREEACRYYGEGKSLTEVKRLIKRKRPTFNPSSVQRECRYYSPPADRNILVTGHSEPSSMNGASSVHGRRRLMKQLQM